MTDRSPPPVKGRGALSNRESRFNATSTSPFDDGWGTEETPVGRDTTVTDEVIRTLIARNSSPDLPFDRSINPYRGCEHGCIYCYARPTHAYLGLSPGLDFETGLVAKTNACETLISELRRKDYCCKPIALGANTDPYQPIERSRRLTRQLLEILNDCGHPVIITTKSSLIERDTDLLAAMAKRHLVEVQVSVTTLSRDLARRLEPRATAPERRLQTIGTLATAGVPVRVLLAPVIPFLNDSDLWPILAAAAERGARSAGYVILRLPLEIGDLFSEWLRTHFPDRADRVLACIRDLHGGRLYHGQFGQRQTGSGPFAQLIQQRFKLGLKKYGLASDPALLDAGQFRPPSENPAQMELFEAR